VFKALSRIDYPWLLACLPVEDSVLEDRYEDYPQLQKLIQLKDKQVSEAAAAALRKR
jgi:hypothetical protein